MDQKRKVFISCELEKQTSLNSPKGTAHSESFKVLFKRLFFPLLSSLQSERHFKEHMDKTGKTFIVVPFLQSKLDTASDSLMGQEEWMETHLPPPSLAEPDLALHRRRKENDTHFLKQGSEMGITTLCSYFQPKIS